MALSRAVSGHVMRALVAHWNHVLLYRRPLLCLMSALYRELPAPSEAETQMALGEAMLTILGRARPTGGSPLVLLTSTATPCCFEVGTLEQ